MLLVITLPLREPVLVTVPYAPPNPHKMGCATRLASKTDADKVVVRFTLPTMGRLRAVTVGGVITGTVTTAVTTSPNGEVRVQVQL